MTGIRDIRSVAPLGFASLLLLPSVAMNSGLLSFDYRFEALLAVSLLLIGFCGLVGFTAAELGLATSRITRYWAEVASLTAALIVLVGIEANFVDARAAPDWSRFVPFYILISCPLQEVVCRAIPKLIADKLEMGGAQYVLFSASAFSLMHTAYGDSLLLLNTFFAGLVWGAAYLATRNIWPLAFSHAAVGIYAFAAGVA